MSNALEQIDRRELLKNALTALEKMQAKLEAVEYAQTEPIAIIGMSCRFPGGATDPEVYWRLLCDGVDAIKELPAERWNANNYAPPKDALGQLAKGYGGFLDQLDQFDPQFFGIAPREAVSMDPQQRLVLEVSWEALERAGQAPDRLSGSQAGVFVGVSSIDYWQLAKRAAIDVHTITGNGLHAVPGRVAYTLGLQGPCMAVDTACSSSLTAVHLACQSLRTGQSNLALAGGVNVILMPEAFIGLSEGGALAPDGRCKTFDARANGFVRGEGCGMVVLKRLSDALAAEDTILALIRGSAVNQDGRSSGFTVPSGLAQQAVIRQALASAGVKPAEVSYVETHGTGTSLGDPIEVEALGTVLREGRSVEQQLFIGSVKTNIGHLEAAAGIAGLIKLVLSMQHEEIPPHLHFHERSPHIPWDELPVVVPTERVPWPTTRGSRRIAGVSSFGMSGINAHVVVEEAPASETKQAAAERPLQLLTLSAKTIEALRDQAAQYERYLAAHAAPGSLADICFTANTGRSHFSHRVAVIGETSSDLGRELAAYGRGATVPGVIHGTVERTGSAKVAFLFTGQGAQYVEMGRELYETAPTFRVALNRCDELLRPHLERPMLSVLYPAAGDSSPLDATAYTQPALFAIEYALAELWRSWGVEPAAVMGHSVGEYVAAFVAGVFSLEEGIALIAQRGRLMQALPQTGSMAVVFGDEARVKAALVGRTNVALAAVNGPANLVISGPRNLVRAVCDELATDGIHSRELTVSHAFHSPLMEPMLEDFARVAARMSYASPQVPLVSNVTGALMEEAPSASYWCRHARQAVRFSAGMQTLRSLGCAIFLELGPTPTLIGMGKNCVSEESGTWLSSLRRVHADWRQMSESLATLYVHGVDIDWAGFDRDYPRRRVGLPTYPFQRKRYWVDAPEQKAHTTRHHSAADEGRHPLLGHTSRSPLVKEILWESRCSTASLPFLMDYQWHGMVALPPLAYLEMALAAATEVFGPGSHAIQADIAEALILQNDEVRTVQLVLTPEDDDHATFQVISCRSDAPHDSAAWIAHATGKVSIAKSATPLLETESVSLSELQTRCPDELAVAPHYQHLRELGLQLGPSFNGITKLWRGRDEVLGYIELAPELEPEAGMYQLHPTLLDACLQLITAAGFDDAAPDPNEGIYMPISVERLQRHGQAGAQLWGHVVVQRGAEGESLAGDARLFDATGKMVAEVQGLHLKHMDPEDLLRATGTHGDDWLYEIEWQRKALRGESATTTPSDSIPAPAQIAARVYPVAGQLIAQHGLDVYDEFVAKVDKVCAAYIVDVLRQLGWEIRLHERMSVVSLSAQLGVVEQHIRLLGRFLEILQEEGILQRDGAEWQVCRVPEPIDPQGPWQELMECFPRDQAALTLVERSGRHLADALRGKYDPLQLLFPGGSFDVADKLYQESPVAVAHNTMAQEVISSVVDQLPGKRIIRVLEIGAGSGGMTSFVLPKLPADRTEYLFTDISPFFTSKAQQRFRAYPFIRYQILNIEQNPEAQGFDPHQFDVIFAASVLHATADLRQSLEHVKQLLAPGGVLMLSEGTRPQRWIDLTFGLTEGWWRFTDKDLRPSYPLLARAKWLQLLAEVGFTGAVTIPDENANGALADQVLILAQAPLLDTSALSTEEAGAGGSWLIFADKSGVGQRLAQLFAARGDSHVLVTPGASYAALERDHFTIEPTCPEDYLRLLRETLGNERLACRGVIHLWGLDVLPTGEIMAAQLAMAQTMGCRSVLHLVQALGTAGAWRAPKLWLVTRGAQPVGSEPVPLAVEQAPLWGMGKVIALEHPELHCTRVDLGSAGEDNEVQALFDEITWGDPEDQVGYRGSVRHVARLVRSQNGRSPTTTGADPTSTSSGSQTEAIVVRSEATYLITGGLGGLGLLMAQWLVSRGARHLALMGRGGASEAAKGTLKELEQAGAQIEVIQGDVSRFEHIGQAFEQIQRALPPLRGVIHSAGVLADGVLLQQDWQRFTEVMAPKIAGAWHLHTLTKDKPLDFFVLFSSLAALLGSAGQSNHAAANAFMDALAFHRRALGLPALSINWGIWSEIGAAARQNVGERLQHGMRTFSPQQGLKVFERVLRPGVTQVGVMPVDWPRFMRQFSGDREPPFFAEMTREARQRRHSSEPVEREPDTVQQLEQAPPSQRHRLLLEYIRGQALKVLGLEASQVVDHRQPLADLGLDSLMAVELRNLLGRGLRLPRSMPATLLYDYPTISELANYMAKEVLRWEGAETSQLSGQAADRSGAIARIEDLSDEEVDRLFAEKTIGN